MSATNTTMQALNVNNGQPFLEPGIRGVSLARCQRRSISMTVLCAVVGSCIDCVCCLCVCCL